MNSKTRKLIQQFVNDNIDSFHQNRILKLRNLRLNEVLKSKNPYLFRAKNLNLASDLITAILDARLSSSEEGSFGGFLEKLAIYVARITGGGPQLKSPATGIDIDLTRRKVRYLIAVKSGKNWGNASQHKQLQRNFMTATRVIRQSDKVVQLQCTLGICYGNFKTINNGKFLHIGGQSFWELISRDRQLYVDLIEPLGFKAEEHDQAFKKEKANIHNRLTREFTIAYCENDGKIRWPKLVRFVSGNLPNRAIASPE